MGDGLSRELRALARGPSDMIKRANGYIVNGYRFHTERLEKKRKTQNSGVFLSALTRGYASSRDENPKEDTIEYFGILEDIIELDYFAGGNVILFKCKWYDTLSRNDRGVKVDQYGYTLVNSKRFAVTEPFVMPNQVEQLFYVNDTSDNDWRVVMRTRPRDLYDQAEVESDNDDELPFSNEHGTEQDVRNNNMDDITWVRNDMDGEIIVEHHKRNYQNRQLRGESTNHQPKKCKATIISEEEAETEEDVEDSMEEEEDDDWEDVDEDGDGEYEEDEEEE